MVVKYGIHSGVGHNVQKHLMFLFAGAVYQIFRRSISYFCHKADFTMAESFDRKAKRQNTVKNY